MRDSREELHKLQQPGTFTGTGTFTGSMAEMTLALGVAGFTYADLFEPLRLRDLHSDFDAWFAASSPTDYERFSAYRACGGEGMSPIAVSDALLAAAPYVSQYIARLFAIEPEVAAFRAEVARRQPLWRFKQEFAKKRVLRAAAGEVWIKAGRSFDEAAAVVCAMLYACVGDAAIDEELAVAETVLAVLAIDDVARKAAKAGGAHWTDDLRAQVRDWALRLGRVNDSDSLTDEASATIAAYILDAFEFWIATRHKDEHDPAHHWASLHSPATLDFAQLVQLRRPSEAIPELIVGPAHHRRERDSFELTDRRMNVRQIEEQVHYCLYCHDRDKDSCSKGLRDNKTRELKKNPIGITLDGCPLDEKISEAHLMRRDGDTLAALSLICIDNPMCPGTGHRICNDCMKGCVFQKQEPVNIPAIETHILTEVLNMPWGVEIYGLLTRWNPLNIRRPYALPYNGKNVLVVGLGPAGYTLAHHLACDGFGVIAVDGLKLEPLPASLVGVDGAPTPVKSFDSLCTELDERVVLGFGGVSEYGITVRWDKNFLTLLYMTLSRNHLLRMIGGVRFGGTLTLDDAWAMGVDHVAIAAGAGRPTIIDMKGNLSRGIRKASDFLMALQLGAYKKSSIANLQVSLPAVVIGGGLTATDTATELLAYYVVQIEKTAERVKALVDQGGESAVRALFDDEEWVVLQEQLAHARELAAERALAKNERREPHVQALLTKWGGVTVAYRRALTESPAYRLNHEEVAKSLEEGVRYIENVSPVEAVLDDHGAVKALKLARRDGVELEVAARTICVAAGTKPNVTYEREHPQTFELDAKHEYFKTHTAVVGDDGSVELVFDPSRMGFFTSYLNGNHTVSFYGDNHPHYAGSVVRAMASAKHGHEHVRALFPSIESLRESDQPLRDRALGEFFREIENELCATVTQVNRLTASIVEVVVRAPLAARKFLPGQFYRLQNFETSAAVVESGGRTLRLAMEGLALTGAWTDPEKGELGLIVLEMGGSSNLCAALKPGESVVLMGPTGAPTEIAPGETVLLAGGGLGNAVLFSIARAYKSIGGRVLYFAGYKRGEDLFKQDEIERYTDQVIWATDSGAKIAPRRPQDRHFRGNIVQAMRAYGAGELGKQEISLAEVHRIIAIGSDRMMNGVREARHGVLLPLLSPRHLAIGSINSPMQCMMKEVCAQCLQKHRDPVTGREFVVFSCFNQDQDLDTVDFAHLNQRLRANSMQEKLSAAFLEKVMTSGV